MPTPPAEKVHWDAWFEAYLLQHHTDIMRLWRRLDPGKRWHMPMTETQIPPVVSDLIDWFISTSSDTADSTTRLDRATGTDTTSLDLGMVMVCDDAGNIYARGPNVGTATVKKYDADGNEVWSVTDAALQLVTWIDVDADHNVYYCGRSAAPNQVAKVVKLDSDGGEVWSSTESISGWNYSFAACAVDASGNVVAVGNRTKSGTPTTNGWIIYSYDSSGSEQWKDEIPQAVFPNNSLGRFGTRCCFDAEGNVYIGFDTRQDPADDSNAIEKYDSSGSMLWGKDLGNDVQTTSLEISPEGKLLAATADSAGGSKLRQYSGADHATTDWTQTIRASASFSEFYAAYDAEGDVYLAIGNTGAEDNFKKLSGVDGSEIYGDQALTAAIHCCVQPGRAPNFI